jgi:hypothetical protein
MVYYQAWTRSYVSIGAICVVTNQLSLAACKDALKIITILLLLLSMPGYITDALQKYQHHMPKRPQHAPHIWTESAYGQRIQYAPSLNESLSASKKEMTSAQQIMGTLLYYACAVDPTLIVASSTLASRISAATATMMSRVNQLLDYCSTHPEANIRYYASDMKLKIHREASYLSEPKAKSCIGGYFYLAIIYFKKKDGLFYLSRHGSGCEHKGHSKKTNMKTSAMHMKKSEPKHVKSIVQSPINPILFDKFHDKDQPLTKCGLFLDKTVLKS